MSKLGQWILTDSDCVQYMRHIEGSYWEGWMVVEIVEREIWRVYHGVIDLDRYNMNSEEFVDEYLNPYGYADVDEVRSLYGTDYEQILAECILETDTTDGDMGLRVMGSFEYCRQYIVKQIAR